MFGINSFEQVGQIIEGHTKEIAHKEQDLYEQRIEICKSCPIFTNSSVGPICDPHKCYNKKTGESSIGIAPGFICGCGCRLGAKARLQNAKCVLGKWNI